MAFAMKQTLSLIILFLSIALVSCKDTHVPVAEHSELSKRIGSVLPQNWTQEESIGQIIISRREPITSYGCIGLDVSWIKHPELLTKDIERNGVRQDYRIRLRLGSKVSREEYTRLQDSNSQIGVTKGTTIQGREFYEYYAMRSFDPRYREFP